MALLEPRNVDVADLLALVRDIGDRLGFIEEVLIDIDDRLDDIETDTGLHDAKLTALIATEPGHDRAVTLAVEAVVADTEDRQSLIPVGDDDSEYNHGCPGCLLKKNGYPRLAQLLADSEPDGDC